MRAKEGLGKVIAVVRVSRGWSQFDLGIAAGLSQQKVHRFEVGQQWPTPAELARIAAALGVEGPAALPRSDELEKLAGLLGLPELATSTEEPTSEFSGESASSPNRRGARRRPPRSGGRA